MEEEQDLKLPSGGKEWGRITVRKFKRLVESDIWTVAKGAVSLHKHGKASLGVTVIVSRTKDKQQRAHLQGGSSAQPNERDLQSHKFCSEANCVRYELIKKESGFVGRLVILCFHLMICQDKPVKVDVHLRRVELLLDEIFRAKSMPRTVECIFYGYFCSNPPTLFGFGFGHTAPILGI